MGKVKTINVAPTWLWVCRMYFSLSEDPKQKKAAEGFRQELERLGTRVKTLLMEYDKKPKLRNQTILKIETICKSIDAHNERGKS